MLYLILNNSINTIIIMSIDSNRQLANLDFEAENEYERVNI